MESDLVAARVHRDAAGRDGHGLLFVLATRKAIDELKLARDDRVFALVKTVALDERAIAESEP